MLVKHTQWKAFIMKKNLILYQIEIASYRRGNQIN